MKKLTMMALGIIASINTSIITAVPLKSDAIKAAISEAKAEEQQTGSNIRNIDQEMNSLVSKMRQKQGDTRYSGAIEKGYTRLKQLQAQREQLNVKLQSCRKKLAQAHRALKQKFNRSIAKHKALYNI